MGRPQLYTEELGERVCAAVAGSIDGLRKTLESDPEFPSMRTVLRWQANNESFRQMYAQAKAMQLQAMAEDIIDIAADESLDPNARRLQVDTRKWLLSKLVAKTYGDKLDVTSAGEALAPPTHQIDARVQSIIMQAAQRKAQGMTEGLDDNALKLLE